MERTKFAIFTLAFVLACIVLFLYRNGSLFRPYNSLPAMVNLLLSDLREDGVNFTSVVLATDLDSLKKLLAFHCSLPCLQKVVVVWNNLEYSVHNNNDLMDDCVIDVTILQQRDNSINNQFKAFSVIETDVVFITQVDVVLSHYDLLLGLEAWKVNNFCDNGCFHPWLRDRLRRDILEALKSKAQFPHLIVGYSPWKVQKVGTKYSYAATAPVDSYNMMLSDAFFVHKKYLHMYSKMSPPPLYNEIHSHHNGDYFSRDVLMNVVVAKHLKEEALPQSPCLWVKASSWNHKRSVSDSDAVLWAKRNVLLKKIVTFYEHDLMLYESSWTVTHKDDLNVFHRTK